MNKEIMDSDDICAECGSKFSDDETGYDTFDGIVCSNCIVNYDENGRWIND